MSLPTGSGSGAAMVSSLAQCREHHTRRTVCGSCSSSHSPNVRSYKSQLTSQHQDPHQKMKIMELQDKAAMKHYLETIYKYYVNSYINMG